MEYLVIRRPPCAFTPIELLVLPATTALLIGLSVPPVQKVRDSAARLQCQNNLKQIGLACHAYHGTHKVLPPGYTATAAYPATSPGWGWAAYLLPYLEQEPLYRQINLALPLEGQPAIQTLIPVFLCPSDSPPPAPFAITSATFTTICQAAPSSYAATVGSDASQVDDPTGNGVFYRNSIVRFTDITDGMSQTVMAGDRAWADSQGTWAGVPANAVIRPGFANPWTSTTGPGP